MLRISKLTDYGIVLLVRFAADEPGTTRTARDMAEATALPLPVVSKMLKALAGAGLLQSQRGSKGGYALARRPEQVSVAAIIEALEGPIALMECSAGPGHCGQEPGCPVSAPWQRINRAIQGTLERVTLRDLVPGGGGLLGIEGEDVPPHAEPGARAARAGEAALRT
jgi:FeS assembly SUF system regulator